MAAYKKSYGVTNQDYKGYKKFTQFIERMNRLEAENDRFKRILFGNNKDNIEVISLKYTDEVQESELSIRAKNILKYENVRNFSELSGLGVANTLRMKGLGRLTLREIQDAMYARGLSLNPPA